MGKKGSKLDAELAEPPPGPTITEAIYSVNAPSDAFRKGRASVRGRGGFMPPLLPCGGTVEGRNAQNLNSPPGMVIPANAGIHSVDPRLRRSDVDKKLRRRRLGVRRPFAALKGKL